MKATAHIRLLSYLLASSALAVAVPTMAQNGNGNNGNGVRRDGVIAPFRLIDDEAEIGFEYYHYGERQKRDGQETLRFQNDTFIEYLKYKARAYVYHPRLFYIRGSAKIGLVQQRIDRSGTLDEDENYDSNSYLDGYEFFVDILKEHPVSGSLFATREKRPVYISSSYNTHFSGLFAGRAVRGA